MSTDYSAKVVVGVQANKYIKYGTSKKQKPVLLDGVPVYTQDGTPIVKTVTYRGYTFKSRFYSEIWKIEELDSDRWDEYKDQCYNEVALYTNGYEDDDLHPDDTIGILLCDVGYGGSRNEVTVEELLETVKLAKKLLAELGITETPAVRTILHVSY